MKKVLLLVWAGALAACAGGDDAAGRSGNENDQATMPTPPTRVLASPDTATPPPVPPSQAVWVRVKEDTLAISNSYLRTGMVKIAVLNEDREVHTIEINSGRARWRTIPVQSGREAVLTVRLDPTEHEVFCVQPGHREKGEYLKFKAVVDPEAQ